ncbi:MAG: MMPL family transporter, partial [Planctomycetales bacterium]
MKLLDFLANAIVRHRAAMVAILVLFSLVACWGFLSAAPREEVRLARPDLQQRDELKTQFDLEGSQCFLVIDVDDLFTPVTTQAIRAIEERVEQLPYVRRVDWIDDIPAMNVFDLTDTLLPDSHADQTAFEAARQRTAEHPMVQGQLLSPDSKTLLMPITIDWLAAPTDEDCSTRLLEVARQTAAQFPDANLRIQLTGQVPVLLAAREAFNDNHFKFQVIGYVMVFALAAVLFRGVSAILIVAIAPALAIFWTRGFLEL